MCRVTFFCCLDGCVGLVFVVVFFFVLFFLFLFCELFLFSLIL